MSQRSRRGARNLLALFSDAGSLEEWDARLSSIDPLGFKDSKPYSQRLEEARRASGRTEAVLTGRVAVDGRPAAVVVGDFSFMAGSMGAATGERIARAFERAAEQGLPMISVTCSGGARMQEGVLGFVQMVKTAQAVKEFRRRGLPYIVYLAHPTSGGVLASWGSLGHVTFAEPGALIGFSGPRVAELTTERKWSANVQTAENLRAHGLIDDVFSPEEIKERIARFLSVAAGRPGFFPLPHAQAGEPAGEAPGEAWDSIQMSRHRDRPGALDLLEHMGRDFTLLGGDGAGPGDDPSCIAVVARVCGVPAVVVGQERASGRGGARMTPAGYRKARRAMSLAAELHLPLVTIIDTPGADLSAASEQGGLAAEIARCIGDAVDLPVPTLSILLGEGGGGGALALFAADRVVCARHAWLAPLSPEGAAAIVFRSTERAADMAAAQGLSSWDLKRFGLADVVVDERPHAGAERDAFLDRMTAVVARELQELVHMKREERLSARRRRYRAVASETVQEGR